MRVTVLGSGNGGTAAAYEWAAAGHEVRLWDFPQFGVNVAAIAPSGVIEGRAKFAGTASVAYAGHDPELLAKLQVVWPQVEPARNVLQTTLQNANPVLHPAIMLLNASAACRRTGSTPPGRPRVSCRWRRCGAWRR